MNSTGDGRNRRILVIDDNRDIHLDFRKILCAPASGAAAALDSAEAALFGSDAPVAPLLDAYEIDSAYQGQEGLRLVADAQERGRPYAMAFVDVRMPPGWDGVETVARIWNLHPDLQVVICTAYSDHTWSDMVTQLGRRDGLLILKKPFDPIEVQQLAAALTEKWEQTRQARLRLAALEGRVAECSRVSEQASEELLAANRALIRAKEAAEAANVAKTRFLANVSHEIRTPLTAILGYADLILDPNQTPESRNECVRVIRRNGDNLLQIINDILDLSKIEAGRLTLDDVECSPVRIVHEVISLMSVRAREKGLALEFDCRGDVPATIRTDPTRLRQILTNLVGNAIKFTESGGVRVVLAIEDAEPDAERRMTIEVIDTGVGIAPELVDRLFRPFSQVDDSAARRSGGTGLGLSISSRLAQAMGGDLTVESAPGRGSTFRLSTRMGPLAGVPFIPAEQARALAVSPEPEPPQNASFDAPCRILLAEDCRDNQRLIAALLRKAGAHVTTADDGRRVLELAAGASFDVILMDMQMPEMDGYTATAALRAMGYDKPIIALTAHAMDADRRQCLDAGCDDHVTKPVRRADLVAAVRRHLGRRAEPVAGV